MDHAISGPATQTVTISGTDYKLPFADALPPLSGDAYTALRDCIAENGIRQFVYVNEHNEVIDGQHRMKIAAELGISAESIPLKVFAGLSPEETEELAYSENCKRRQLSKEDLVNLCVARRKDGWSTRKISRLTGIPTSTVARYLAGVSSGTPAISLGQDGKAYPATKLTVIEREQRRFQVTMLSTQGKTHGEISERLGVSPRTVASDLHRPLQAHPALEDFPEMTPEELSDLKDSILSTGLLDPIVLMETGSGVVILDGRQRHRACLDLGVTPEFKLYDGSDPEGFIYSCNYFRRHYTEDQIAEIWRKLAEYEATVKKS